MELESVYQCPENSQLQEMNDQQLRRHYAQDEICVQVVAWFYLFFGSSLATISLILLWLSIEIDNVITSFMSFSALLAALVYQLIGWGMRHYDPWSRAPARFAAIVMMFFIPLGTLTGLLCFSLLRTRADEAIFTTKYRAILLSEPNQGKYLSLWLPIVFGTLTGLLLALAVYLQRHLIIELLSR
ncbi:hypothetical protein [Rubritalea tangerina]|uniref:Transmembrane protein n=1 Tax=Rubritalea tangerina TaxID=430798 RepID=A0ABW4ZET8_9BACT